MRTIEFFILKRLIRGIRPQVESGKNNYYLKIK
jgi:hypothetical protein